VTLSDLQIRLRLAEEQVDSLYFRRHRSPTARIMLANSIRSVRNLRAEIKVREAQADPDAE
jgi:hypothetical protein